jgi:hypothetical protein
MDHPPTAELHALRLAVDMMACHLALVVAPTTRLEQIRATAFQLYWDLRPLSEHSDQVDAVLDALAQAERDEEDTIDLERFGRRLVELRGAAALLPLLPNESRNDRAT